MQLYRTTFILNLVIFSNLDYYEMRWIENDSCKDSLIGIEASLIYLIRTLNSITHTYVGILEFWVRIL